jgi:hypothetical protein
MPRYRITSPEGKTFIINAPEGATKEQALAYAQQNFPKPPSDYENEVLTSKVEQSTNALPALAAYAGNAAQALPFVGTFTDEAASHIGSALGLGEGDGFGERYKDLQLRQQISREAGQQLNPIATGIGQAGTALATLPFLPQTAPQATLGGKIVQGAKIGSEMGVAYGAGISDERQQNGLSDRLLNASVYGTGGGILGGALPVATSAASKVFELGGKAADYVSKLGKGITPERMERATGMPDLGSKPDSSKLKKMANYLYGLVENSTEQIPANSIDGFLANAEKTLPSEEVRKLTSITGLGSEASDLVEKMQSLRGKPMSIQAATELDQQLNEIAFSLREKGVQTKGSVGISKIRNELRQVLKNAPFGKEARETWAMAQKLRDVENVESRASMLEQPSTGIKSGARIVLGNEARSAGYTPEELKLWQQAAKPDILTDLLRSGASRIAVPMAGATGGIGNAAAAGGISTIAREMANRLQYGATDQLKREILKKIIGSPQNQFTSDFLRSSPALAAQSYNLYRE